MEKHYEIYYTDRITGVTRSLEIFGIKEFADALFGIANNPDISNVDFIQSDSPIGAQEDDFCEADNDGRYY